jgi:hypothetical protein
MFTQFKGGLQAPYADFEKPRLYVDDFLLPAASQRYGEIDWTTGVTDWGMDMNGPDPSNPPQIPGGIGICGWAGPDHLQMAITAATGGTPASWGNDALLHMYELTGGYRLGDPSTDNGTVLQDNLGAWRKAGVPAPSGDDRILAFGALKPGSWLRPERIQALSAFAGIIFGHNLPQSAEQQFPGPWTYVPGSPVAGGHCTVQLREIHGTDEIGLATWGRIVSAQTRFLLSTVVEAWVVFDTDFVERNGRNPAGLDVTGMNEALASLTRQSNPLNLRPIL